MSSSELFEMPSETPAEGATAPRGESQSLYRKHRPQSFAVDELVGQEHIVQTLRNAIVLGRVAHAYLFCGPRGTGKTTTARLLAKAVNCLDPDPTNRPCNVCSACVAINTGATTDVIEIDAASNRGIDDIRDLRERVKYAPTQLATKFYIIDEAHQITGAAANAFLKTLEEPPAHTHFVLATTDPEELLQTIVSRCQRFDFRKISLESMIGRLETVVKREGLQADRPALEAIARYGTGSLRDSIGLLDQLSVYQEEAGESGERVITVEAVRSLLGISRNDRIVSLVTAIADRDAANALELVNAAVDAGDDARQINRQLVAYLRDLMFARAGAARDADEATQEIAQRFSVAELSALAKLFSEVDFHIKRSLYAQLPLEIALVEAVTRGTTQASRTPDLPTAQAAPPPTERARTAPPVQDEPIAERPPTNRLAGRVRQPPPANRQPEAKSESPLSVAPPPGIVRSTATNNAETDPASNEGQESTKPMPPAEVSGGLTVGAIAEQWNQIRLDVKSTDRRVEALLAAADPYDVAGNEVRLVTPYDFHARKLNEDGPRGLISDVIGRLFGQRVYVTAFQVGRTPPQSTPVEMSDAPAPKQDPREPVEPTTIKSEPAPVPDEQPPTQEPTLDPAAILEERKRSAMSIFDAVPIDNPGEEPGS